MISLIIDEALNNINLFLIIFFLIVFLQNWNQLMNITITVMSSTTESSSKVHILYAICNNSSHAPSISPLV